MNGSRYGTVIFLEQCPSPKVAGRRGLAGWTRCLRCERGVGIPDPAALAKLTAGTFDPLCQACGTELYEQGDLRPEMFRGVLNAFGQIVPPKEPS